ncbi:MAG TPA: hypothetical protein VK778_04225 [Solirubrobacteraceae bacterium]|jgi:hypothetical protein|nr:hypothetical protein [Solirubrobacteraceae bacterium]
MQRGRDRCNQPYARAAVQLVLDKPGERELVLAAVGVLLLELADTPGGPPPQRFLQAGSLAAQLTQGARRVRVPVAIVRDLRRAVDGISARALTRSA